MDNGILTSAIQPLPLLSGADKKKIKDSIVKHIVSNPRDFIDSSFCIEVEELIDGSAIKKSISESLGAAIKDSKEFKKELANQVIECAKDEINNIYEDGELLDRDDIVYTISTAVVKSLKSSFNL